jgi:pSer/pThr/pTyr-binding forkhead associated (FHA) protein
MFRTARWCRFSALFVLLLAPASAFAQSDLRLVAADVRQPTQLDLLVEIPEDVSSPAASDFQLLEDSRPTLQASTSTPFRSSEWTLTAALVIDTSGSVRRHVASVAQKLSDFAGALPPNDAVALLTFDDEVHDDVPFDASRDQLREGLARMQARGKRTVLYQALNRGLDLLKQRDASRTWQRLIVISDGADESSEETAATDSIIDLAIAQHVAIDTIWLGPLADATRNTLVRLSERTAGVHTDALTPKQPADISDALQRVNARITRAVVLSFVRRAVATETTKQVGVSLTGPRTATASLALQIPQSVITDPVPPASRWSWLLWGLLLLLVLYVLYTAAYLVVGRFAPDRLALFPFKPLPWLGEKAIELPPLIPTPIEPESRPERHTVVQRAAPNVHVPQRAGAEGLALEVIEGPLKGRRIVVNHPRYQIGAGPDNDLRITSDNYLSSTHALLQAYNGQWLVSDQESSNGTFVNGRRIPSGQGQALQHGHVIRVGASEFRVLLERPAPDANPPRDPNPPRLSTVR